MGEQLCTARSRESRAGRRWWPVMWVCDQFGHRPAPPSVLHGQRPPPLRSEPSLPAAVGPDACPLGRRAWLQPRPPPACCLRLPRKQTLPRPTPQTRSGSGAESGKHFITTTHSNHGRQIAVRSHRLQRQGRVAAPTAWRVGVGPRVWQVPAVPGVERAGFGRAGSDPWGANLGGRGTRRTGGRGLRASQNLFVSS